MTATAALTTDLKRVVLVLENDLRQRVAELADVAREWREEHRQALERGRTASAWVAWRDDRITQVAVSWVLATVFVRFCEDNRLLGPVWISGPGDRHREALDARNEYFRANPEHTDREWLQQAIAHLADVRATAALVDEHAPLHLVSPSGQAASDLVAFWWRRDESGLLMHDFQDDELSTRFLGDLYQDLSDHAKDTYALLQTPVFVEEFILDRTLEPALAERPLEGFRMIDPTCGSGHFLLGAFSRLLDRWHRRAPAMEVQARVQAALDAVHGVDLNAFAVAIARFRLTVQALRACDLSSLEQTPAFKFNLAVGDSLLHGPGQQTLGGDADLTGFVYDYEDLVTLQSLLAGGRYDAVVGNPPYITVKDKVLNQAYRDRYRSCKGTYALTVPFMERFFNLAKPATATQMAGWAGQITSNSFMKREFGSKIIEEHLALKDLRLVVDTSGAYIPGHGTPTVILVGRNQRPMGETVRSVLGIRGEPGRPEVPEKGMVWRSITGYVDQAGWSDEWVSVADLPRTALATHPWSLSGGGAADLLSRLQPDGAALLSSKSVDSGFMVVTREDDAYMLGKSLLRRCNIDPGLIKAMAGGSNIRDWRVEGAAPALVTYSSTGAAQIDDPSRRILWPYKRHLSLRRALGGTQEQLGREWWEYSQLNRRRFASPYLLTFPFVATHNHFTLDRRASVFKRTAPVVRLSEEASENDHLGLLGVLNSSTACFWLKQNSHGKGNGGVNEGFRGDDWEEFFEFTGTTLQDYPLPSKLPLARGRRLDALARRLAETVPAAVAEAAVPTAATLAEARDQYDGVRGQMVAEQEELDWEVYRLYGLIDEDLTYGGPDLPELALGQRAFEVALARRLAEGSEASAWFARHGSTPTTELPDHWPADYRALVRRRLEVIATDPSHKLLERPEHKRRWAGETWEKQQTAALRDWLLDRLEDREFWFDRQGRPTPLSVAQLADRVERDADLVSVLALWQGHQGVPVTQSLTALLVDEAVPYLAAMRYKESGLRKREAWEATWALQRREDAGEQVGTIAVPPKYSTPDFRKVSYWQARGKLDVPKERFIAYPGAGRDTDPTPLLGWAGWNHAQQSLALSTIIAEREGDGWSDDRLVPLVAGLAELQPWVEQWHAEVDPEMGLSLASYCAGELTNRMAQVGATTADLARWRPEPATRGRKPRKVAT